MTSSLLASNSGCVMWIHLQASICTEWEHTSMVLSPNKIPGTVSIASLLQVGTLLDKYHNLSPLLCSRTTLIASCGGGKGENPPTYKMRTIFSYVVPIFNKKSSQIRAVETFKLWPNLKVCTASVR